MKFIPALILSSVLAATLTACAERSSDEQQIRELVASVEKAAEARDTSDVLAHVASSYSDERGFDKTRLQNFLRGYFLANPNVELVVGIESVELPVPGLAKARVGITVLPAGDTTTLDVELRREDDEWRVVRADRAREAR
jgi:hypothetical protein